MKQVHMDCGRKKPILVSTATICWGGLKIDEGLFTPSGSQHLGYIRITQGIGTMQVLSSSSHLFSRQLGAPKLTIETGPLILIQGAIQTMF